MVKITITTAQLSSLVLEKIESAIRAFEKEMRHITEYEFDRAKAYITFAWRIDLLDEFQWNLAWDIINEIECTIECIEISPFNLSKLKGRLEGVLNAL